MKAVILIGVGFVIGVYAANTTMGKETRRLIGGGQRIVHNLTKDFQ